MLVCSADSFLIIGLKNWVSQNADFQPTGRATRAQSRCCQNWASDEVKIYFKILFRSSLLLIFLLKIPAYFLFIKINKQIAAFFINGTILIVRRSVSSARRVLISIQGKLVSIFRSIPENGGTSWSCRVEA